jgi:hypothetical protein
MYDIFVRFEVFTAVNMKKAVFWVVALCSSFVTAATCSRWFLAGRFFYPEDGGDMILQNVGSHRNYTTPQPRKRLSL